MTDTKKLAIWWVTQADCEAIGEAPVLPDYLKTEYASRLGRAGRGRLWVPDEIELQQVAVPKCVVYEGKSATGNDTHGGIVLWKEDVEKVRPFGGIISDTNGNVL